MKNRMREFADRMVNGPRKARGIGRKMGKCLAAGGLAVTTGIMLCACGARQSSAEASNRLEQIKQKGYIEVVTEPYFAPNEFIDSTKTGDEQYVGADIELARYIADKLGVELQ